MRSSSYTAELEPTEGLEEPIHITRRRTCDPSVHVSGAAVDECVGNIRASYLTSGWSTRSPAAAKEVNNGSNYPGVSQCTPATLGVAVKLPSIAVIFLLFSGCVANPEKLCASLVPPGWSHVAAPTDATGPLVASSPGHFLSKDTLWFSNQSDRFIACTLDKQARDTCSVETTEFEKSLDGWKQIGGNAVLCNVAITHRGSQ